MIPFEPASSSLQRPPLQVETKEKNEALLRKPIGILLSLLGLLLFAAAAIPVCAQFYPQARMTMRNAKIQEYQNLLRRQMLSTGRYPSGELIELHNHFGRDMSPDMGVPGARLAREAYVDIYAHNYNGAITVLQKAVRLGNEDAMLYLSYCYFYGHGVPQNLATAMQLQRTVGIATARRVLRIDREQQAERAQAARAYERRIETAAASSSYQSPPAKYQGFKGPLVLTPFGLKARTPLTEVWDTSH